MIVTFLLTLTILLLVVIAMSVGVIFRQTQLRGSCGGTGQQCRCDHPCEKKQTEHPIYFQD